MKNICLCLKEELVPIQGKYRYQCWPVMCREGFAELNSYVDVRLGKGMRSWLKTHLSSTSRLSRRKEQGGSVFSKFICCEITAMTLKGNKNSSKLKHNWPQVVVIPLDCPLLRFFTWASQIWILKVLSIHRRYIWSSDLYGLTVACQDPRIRPFPPKILLVENAKNWTPVLEHWAQYDSMERPSTAHWSG